LGQTLAPTSGKTVAPPADTSLIYKRQEDIIKTVGGKKQNMPL
jgi:hypothetical protein